MQKEIYREGRWKRAVVKSKRKKDGSPKPESARLSVRPSVAWHRGGNAWLKTARIRLACAERK